MSEISSTGDQMLSVLDCVAKNGPMSVSQISEACSINRTVTYRLLNTLIKNRYAQKSSRGYVLGPAAFDLTRTAVPGMIVAAKRAMEQLSAEIDETVILHGIVRNEAVALDQVLSRNRLVMVRHTPGSRHALNRGASGWALLSFQSDPFIEKILAPLSSHEVQNAKSRIAQVKSDGFATSADELQQGVHGLFVPLIDGDGRCDYSFGVVVPSIRAHVLNGLSARLQELSKTVSQQID